MKSFLTFLVAIALLVITFDGNSQIKVNLKNKVENQTNNRANQKTDQAIDKGLDKIEGIFKKKDKNQQQNQEGQEKQTQQETQNNAQTPPAAAPQDAQPSLQAFTSYDFVPGDKVLLFEDFSQDAVGDFPALWTTDVAGEVNTLNISPGNWFNLNSGEGTYWFMKDIDFPKNFIIEFDIVPKKGGMRYAADLVLFGESQHSEMDKNGDPGDCGVHITIAKTLWDTKGYKKGVSEKLTGSSNKNLVQEEKVNHVIVWVQNRRLRIYHQGGKVLDVPTNIYEGSKFTRMCFKLYRGASCGSYISNIKITNASPDTRNKLLTEGKLVTYGIYFDVNKDVVKPESYGALKDIATILNEVPDVKVKIVGHTDSDGADAANLDLSKRRAASVKAELVKSFGVNGDRLETEGMGETKPVAPNDTPVNKALNRRVEFLNLNVNPEAEGASAGQPAESKSVLQSYSKFDFIPGAKIIFFDDFAETAIGDFPANWNTDASGEVVKTNLYPGNWFKMNNTGCVIIDNGIKLPDNYTIEFDAITVPKEEGSNSYEFGFYLYNANDPKDMNEGGAVPGMQGGVKMDFGYRSSYSGYDAVGYTLDGSKEDAVMEPGKKYHLSFWIQKTRLRVYLDEVKVFDVPKIFKPGYLANQMRFELWDTGNPLVTNFRVAAGLPDTRNKLLTEGKLVTYGIYFDVNKDVVKPESYGTLKDIAAVLNEVPDVKVKIVGHTDSDGQDAANLDLSKRRAAAVKAELVKTFGVKGDRLVTDGMGETKPVAPNDTPVNKALNRRVEFIKL